VICEGASLRRLSLTDGCALGLNRREKEKRVSGLFVGGNRRRKDLWGRGQPKEADEKKEEERRRGGGGRVKRDMGGRGRAFQREGSILDSSAEETELLSRESEKRLAAYSVRRKR